MGRIQDEFPVEGDLVIGTVKKVKNFGRRAKHPKVVHRSMKFS